MYVLHFQNLVNDDWVQAWGVLRGPAYVQVATTPGLASASTVRIMPLALAGVVAGGYSGAEARALLASGLKLVDAADDGTRAGTVPAIRGGSGQMRWWPRVVVPFAAWSPAFFVDPTAAGQIWTAYFGVTWAAEVAAGVESVVEAPIAAPSARMLPAVRDVYYVVRQQILRRPRGGGIV